MLKKTPTLFCRLSLIAYACLMLCPVANAKDSLWYKTDDPLKTESALPPAIPDGYLESAACNAINYNESLNLSQVVEAALCNNPQTQQAYASARAQAAQLGIAKSAYLPTLDDKIGTNANVNTPELATRSNPYGNLTNSLVASYLLYDFGSRDANLENARQLLQAASATQSSIVQTILLNAIQAFYQVQANIASLSAANESERASEESFKAAQARYLAGVSTPADKLQAQTLFAQNTLTRITAEGTLKTSYGTLANVMGLVANKTLKLVPSVIVQPLDFIDQDINAMIEQARNRRPDLLASEAQLKAAQAAIEASRAASKPTFTVSLSNSYSDGSRISNADNSALGLSVSIPIFGGYAPTYRIRAAEANADLRSAVRDQLRLQVSLDVWTAYQNLRTANESIHAATVLVSSAEESSRVALGRYKAGVGNIIDTLNAQSALASARQQKIQANLNLNIARSTLAQSIGSLDNAMIQSLPNSNTTGLNTSTQERQP